MISLRQLAKIAGVSPSTAVRVLHGRANVAPATRERVLRCASEHHYTRLTIAQPPKSQTIGFIIPSFESIESAMVVQALTSLDMLPAMGLRLYPTQGRLECITQAIDQCLDHRVDGIYLHSGSSLPVPANVIHRIRAHGIPIVTRDVSPTEIPTDWAGHDEEAIGEMAVAYLADMGHRSIAIVGPMERGIGIGRPRGLYHALDRRGLSTDHFIDVNFQDTQDSKVWQHLANLLRMPSHLTAVIGLGGTFSLMALHIAHTIGRTVPKALSILSTGNYHMYDYTFPPLTAIEQSVDDVGAALKMLIGRMEHPQPADDHTVTHITVAARLVERASCAPPALHP
jgi:DNA-binding LacI/PurR family transcriptional regulator